MLNWIVSRLFGREEERRGSGPETAAQPGEDADGTRTNRANEEDGANQGTSSGVGDAPPVDSVVGSSSLDSWQDLLDEDDIPKQTIWTELGLQPHEFLVWLVRDAGGRMWQAELVETTGWSKSTVSRYLDSLETDGTVERVWVGRQKLVSLPEAASETPETTDEPAVDTSATRVETASTVPLPLLEHGPRDSASAVSC
jgi:hypothetical protein